MKRVPITCHAGVWPRRFSGQLALGIWKVRTGSPDALWLVFTLTQGTLDSVEGKMSDGGGIPHQINALVPAIVTAADRPTWELIAADKKAFYAAVESNKVHISGDFRVFARHTPGLIRLVEGTDLWSKLDHAAAAVSKQEDS